MTLPASEDPRPACLCPGGAEGKHGLLCEHLLRGAFGSVGDAPEYVRQILRDKGRLVAGAVVTAEIEAADDLGSE